MKIKSLLGAGAAFLSVVLFSAGFSYGMDRERLAIHIEVSAPAASFMPDEAFGASLDGLEEDDFQKTYTPENIKTMAGAPYRKLAYRLRTELGIEAWHWNETGSWSDETHKEGYWTSSETLGRPVMTSMGYKLPRRGSTVDQAGNDGYSRLDDGSKRTFWKSNPYLDAYFTGEDNALHPQWVLVDLGKRHKVNALRILWGEPYATRYEVQYWDGQDGDSPNGLYKGTWRPFKGGSVDDGKGGNAMVRVEENPVPVRFVRILLKASSGTALQKKDVRDRLGYAIRELYIGTVDRRGRLQDVINHGKSNTTQTQIIVSSTDPWHRATDRNPKSTHPGFDRIIASGLGRGNSILTPVALLYDTPENAAAEIRFLKFSGFPVDQIELGEEPDGQYMSPEHYGALYLQFAKVIHDIDPALITGGPSFQSEVTGWHALADEKGERSWMKRFLHYLSEHKRLDDLGFFSFEWYPFDDVCSPPTEQLIEQSSLLKKALEYVEEEGVPRTIPWIINEFGYSSFAGRPEVELSEAILNAEIVAQFLTLGGKTTYYYGLEPNRPIRELDGCAHKDMLWGNLMMFQAGANGKAKWLLPAYYGGKMVMEEWAEPVNAPHQLYRASAMQGDKVGNNVTAYVVHRPDRRWSVMVLNKGTEGVELEKIQFDDGERNNEGNWSGPLDVIQYSSEQYEWRADGAHGHPKKSEPPVHFQISDGLASPLILPPMSLTVIRGSRP